MVDVIMTVA